METRNPYLILGVPFGTAREEAAKAFARRMRSLPSDLVEAEARRNDLTWAIRWIEEQSGRPVEELAPYRFPADPQAGAVAGAGVLNPPAERRSFRPAEVADALAKVRAGAAREVLRQLLTIRAGNLTPPDP